MAVGPLLGPAAISAYGGIRLRAFDRLTALWCDVADLERTAAVLEWDQLVNMPPGGAAARGEQFATVRRLAHERLTAPAVPEALAAAEAQGDLDEAQRAYVRVARRVYDREANVPADLVQDMAKASTEGYFAWVQARQSRSFAAFAPQLARLLKLARRYADAVGHGGQPYDALLGVHEPGMVTSRVAEVFTALRTGLLPLIGAIAEQPPLSRALFEQPLDEAGQWRAGERAITEFGYDWRRGRQDRSVHPFSTSFSPGDCRITTRLDPGDFGVGFFATLHEAGHAMYEQGLPEAWARGPLGQASSTGVHESQSRLWENYVGRSRPFWSHFLPVVAECLPGAFAHADPEAMYRAANVVRPGLIRVEADEVTYNLHVALRFELELGLLSGDLPLDHLPAAWNDGMAATLGVRPATDLEGCLQDVHWSGGSFGYFPSYTLGNVLAAQWMETAARAVGDLPAQIGRGEFAPLLEWLRQNIHGRGAALPPDELVLAITGGPIDTAPYLEYIRTKYGELYGV